jgi:hypothetical protein
LRFSVIKQQDYMYSAAHDQAAECYLIYVEDIWHAVIPLQCLHSKFLTEETNSDVLVDK